REERVKKDTEKKGIAEIIIAKQRNGPIRNVELKFWEKYTKFDNLDRIHGAEEY
nr:DnaB-like helicase C-terminal domain-containing protein [Spirochaetota bacterium]